MAAENRVAVGPKDDPKEIIKLWESRGWELTRKSKNGKELFFKRKQ